MLRQSHVNQVEALVHKTELSADVVPGEEGGEIDEIMVQVSSADPDQLGTFLSLLGDGFHYEVAAPSVNPGLAAGQADRFRVTIRDSKGLLSSI